MKAYKENILNIVLSVNNLIFIFIMIVEIYSINNINFVEVISMYISGSLIFIFLSKFLSKNLNKRLCIMLVILIVLIFIFQDNITNFMKEKIFNKVYNIETEINLNNSSNYNDFKYIFAIIVPVMTTLTLALVKMNLEHIIVFLNFFIIMIFYYIGFKNVILNEKYLVILSCLILILFGKLKEFINKCKKARFKVDINYKFIAFKILLGSLMVTVITVMLPTGIKGRYYDKINKCLNEKLYSEKDSEKYVVDEAYNVKQLGYSDSTKKLGGKLKLSDEKVMEVYSYSGDLYLRGSVKEFYTGHSWETLNKNLTLMQNDNENIIEMDKYLNNENAIKKEEIKIVPINNKIRAMFAPIYTSNIKCENHILYSERYDTFFSKTHKMNPYTVEYYDEKPIQERMMEASKNNYKSEFISAYLDDSKITKDTLDLTLDIVCDAKSNQEKVEKIVEYLNKNYKYSLDVSEVPQNEDFVNYFLFKEKQGYCVYFASALAMMCRIVDIPARYIEGFKVPNTPVEPGKYEVTNKDAHAWVEALIDLNEQLWTTIDCSPTQTNIVYNENTEGTADILPDTNIDSKQEINDNLNKEENKKYEKSEVQENKSHKKEVINNNIILRTLLLVIILLLICFVVKISISMIKIKRISKSSSATKIYLYYLRRLKSVKICKTISLTDLEFVQSLEDKELKEKLLQLVMESYKTIYGNNESKINSNEYLKFIDAYLKTKVNVINYFLYKYILI